jgi:hypothetical protein
VQTGLRCSVPPIRRRLPKRPAASTAPRGGTPVGVPASPDLARAVAPAPTSVNGDWRRWLLHDLNAPASAVNLQALRLWAASEGMAPEYHNPLATTLVVGASHPINSVGVQRYANNRDGAKAIAHTLRESRYDAVRAAFHKGNSLRHIYEAINGSLWCHGCQHGHYPVGIYQQLVMEGKATQVANLPANRPQHRSGDITPAGDDWSPIIRASAGRFAHAARKMAAHRARLRTLRGR